MASTDVYSCSGRSAAFRIGVLPAVLALAVMMAGCGPNSSKGVYDTVYSFGASGNAASIKGSGWSKAEEQFTWTEGNVATLVFPITPTDSHVTLRVTAAGMIKEPEFPTHPVEVSMNDQKIADWEVGNTAPFSAAIPPEFTKAGGKLTVAFKMPKAVSPKQLGKNEDPRVLGICVLNAELATK